MFSNIFNAIGGFGLAKQQKRASNAISIDENKFAYQGSPFAKRMLQNAEMRRNAQMPGLDIMQAQQNQANTNAYGAFQRAAGSGSNLLAMAAVNAAQSQQAGLGLAGQAAGWNQAMNSEYNQALGVMQNEDVMKFQTAAQREMMKEQRKQSLMDASQANKQRALGEIGGFLDSAASTAVSLFNPVNGLMKGKAKGVSGAADKLSGLQSSGGNGMASLFGQGGFQQQVPNFLGLRTGVPSMYNGPQGWPTAQQFFGR
jgi:hypothetical protein